MHRFLIVIEKAGKISQHAHPTFLAASQQRKTRESAKEQMHEVIAMHIRGLPEDGLPVPKSHSSATFIAVRAE